MKETIARKLEYQFKHSITGLKNTYYTRFQIFMCVDKCVKGNLHTILNASAYISLVTKSNEPI